MCINLSQTLCMYRWPISCSIWLCDLDRLGHNESCDLLRMLTLMIIITHFYPFKYQYSIHKLVTCSSGMSQIGPKWVVDNYGFKEGMDLQYFVSLTFCFYDIVWIPKPSLFAVSDIVFMSLYMYNVLYHTIALDPLFFNFWMLVSSLSIFKQLNLQETYFQHKHYMHLMAPVGTKIPGKNINFFGKKWG